MAEEEKEIHKKEAEEWVIDNVCKDCSKYEKCKSKEHCTCKECSKEKWQKGAEFGYNKANEWHNIRENPNDLPTDNSSLYYVLVYSWDFGLSHLYSKYGTYIPTVCEWDGEHFKALDRGAYTNARNIRNCFAWKEIELPKEIKE